MKSWIELQHHNSSVDTEQWKKVGESQQNRHRPGNGIVGKIIERDNHSDIPVQGNSSVMLSMTQCRSYWETKSVYRAELSTLCLE